MHDEVAAFVANLLHSATVAHFQHWATPSRSDHLALATYYDEIIDRVDKLAESYMGRDRTKLTKFPSEFHLEMEPLPYFEKLLEFVDNARKHLPQNSELQNRVDDITELINETLYQLRELK